MVHNIQESLKKIIFRMDQFLTAKRILQISFFSALFFTLFYVAFYQNIYRDVANCYAYYAREFSREGFSMSLPSALPPLNIFLAGVLAMTGISAFASVILVSGFFYIASIFPLFGILKRFTTPKAAAWGCLLFIFAPKMIRFANTGLLESARDFFMLSALCVMFRYFDTKKIQNLFYLGLASGLLFLSRGEGIFPVTVIIIAFVVLDWKTNQYQAKKLLTKTLPALLLILAVILAVFLPRMIGNYKTTGYPVPDSRMIDYIKKSAPFVTTVFTDKRPPKKIRVVKKEKKSIAKQASTLVQHFTRGAYELYLVFAVLGMILMIFRKQWRAEYTLFLALIAGYLLVFFLVGSSYRYHIYAIPLLMIFTLTGLGEVIRQAEKYKLKELLFLVFAVILIFQAVNALCYALERGNQQKELANWIQKNRQTIAPGVAPGKLILHSAKLPELCYWLDEERLYEYSEPEDPPETVRGFDLCLIHPRSKEIIEIMRKRSDLTELKHPFPKEAAIFIPLRKTLKQ